MSTKNIEFLLGGIIIGVIICILFTLIARPAKAWYQHTPSPTPTPYISPTPEPSVTPSPSESPTATPSATPETTPYPEYHDNGCAVNDCSGNINGNKKDEPSYINMSGEPMHPPSMAPK